MNTIESIFDNIELDDLLSAYLFFDTTIAYLGKYNRFDTMEKLLVLMKETIPMDQDHKRELATYELYKGYIASRIFDFPTGIQHFKNGIKAILPIEKEYAELATNLYNNLASIYLITDKKEFKQCMETIMEIRKNISPSGFS